MCDACSLQELDSEDRAVTDFLQVMRSYDQQADDYSDDDDSESGVQYELRLDSLPFFQQFM